ncbi:tetratricopeptide repeat protein [Aquimarina sp. U1-2]|uniref:tetratricopeptide repeat protein n=1 Tax=Aquimarina sp. U1-2 TaxID=2823141 RepID=UPI001AECB817|nr:tetratricopeptide repeat protein [Aquimarina sp. U1-2]MBP2833256.1 tetratricopeptide repeat protein [Aquimarina sp. U1-2]
MEKFLKFYLSGFVLILIVFSCAENPTPEDKRISNEMINGGDEIVEAPELQGTPESMIYIEKALAIDPENADAWRMLSIPYLKRGMPTRWKPLFDKAVELNPEEWQGWRGYLYLYFYRNYKKAIEDFNATDILTPNFDDTPQGQSVNYMRGLAYLGLKDYTKSKSFFDTYINDQIKASGEDYVDVTAFLYRGIVAYLEKDYNKAIEDFHKVLKYSGNHYADAHFYLSKCFLKQKDINNARRHITKAIEDFNTGFVHKRGYVEVLYQIYIQDLEELKKLIENS